MPNQIVRSFDYNNVKEELKRWLSEQKPWINYNLDASGIDTIISALAYASHIDAMTAAMLFNEAFLATAQTRLNVVKAAKALGYTPNSATPATAVVNITISEGSSPLPSTLYLPKGTVFSAKVSGDTSGEHPQLKFTTTETYSADRQPGGIYRFNGVKVVQGFYKIHSDIVNNSRKYKVYDLPDKNVVIDSIEVFVHTGAEDDEYEEFVKADNIITSSVRHDGKVFFVEEIRDEKYGIYFGDGKLGVLPNDGAIVRISYLVCDGSAGNGYDEFSFVETPNLNDPINDAVWVVNTVERSHGGSDLEDVESIRLNARNMWVSQNRAVTAHDYHAMIMNSFSDIRDISVWGGEENDPPVWGKVFVCPLPKQGVVVPISVVNKIKNWFRKGYGVLTTQIEVVQPDPIFMIPVVSVVVDPAYPFFDREKLAQKIIDRFYEYLDSKVVGFGKAFRYSDAVTFIDDIDNAILSSSISMSLSKKFVVPPDTKVFSVDSSFNNRLEVGSFSSTSFITQIGSEKPEVSIVDKDGSGKLQLVDVHTGVVLNDNVGIIDYGTGRLQISPVKVIAVPDGPMMVRLSASPAKQNVFSDRQHVIVIDKNDISVSIGSDQQ